MSRIKGLKCNRNVKNTLATLPIVLFSASASATDFTAGIVMEKMNEAERFQYLAGVIEGLAYSRFVKDGKKTEGMGCIYQWFYEKKETVKKIESAFRHFQNHLPGAVVAAMVEKECGA